MHRRPRLSLTLLAALLAVLVAAGVGAVVWFRSRPVTVSAPDGGSDPWCARFATTLPAELLDQPRRETSSRSAAVAAWGDPAIIWRCGVPAPGPTRDECIDVDGVDWVATALDDGTSFTTYGREPAVQVLVPRHYSPEPLALPVFSRVVAALPQGARRCT